MTEALGVILICFSALSEHCEVTTSPTVFNTLEECQDDVIRVANKLKKKYSYATIRPNCVELKYDGVKT